LTLDTPLIAVLIFFCSPLISVESWSSDCFACAPDFVFGLPRFLTVSASVCVAEITSSAALCRVDFETLPPFTELTAELIELCQVVIAEQRLFAQSAVDVVVVVVLLLPQPAARSTAATPATSTETIVRMASSLRDCSPAGKGSARSR